MYRLLITVGLFCLLAVSAIQSNANNYKSERILPPNRLHLQDDLNKIANITEEEFNEIIDSVTKYYKPIIREHGARLSVSKKWRDSTVNAYAQQRGNNWMVAMFGGLARRKEVTRDGFALVVCHELGHHLAGFAFYGDRWAASEGQSDYFATHACARKIWSKEFRENRKHRRALSRTYERECNRAWGTANNRALCYRIANASQSLANLLAVLGRQKMPKFDTPDRARVRRTSTSHPKAQCRLDTYFQGSLCKKIMDESVIPGKNHPAGQMSLDAEKEAAQYTCHRAMNFTSGVRPLCWFAPRLKG